MQDKWSTSRALLDRARGSLAGGVSSPFRAKAPVPLYFKGGCGCRLRDVDDNEYIDYALAWGPLILGHCHPRMVETLREYAGKPHTYGAQHEPEFQVAELFQASVPCAERIAFTSSGSEAVQLSLRLARAFTGRNVIVKFEGHYHGWLDSVLISYHPSAEQAGDAEHPTPVLASRGQVPNAVDNVIIVPWNRRDLLSAVFTEHGKDIAAVITEPILCNSGCILPLRGFLKDVRAMCTANNSLLIFDEVITGFRLAVGGAQAHYGVTPDIATFGKALGAGVPISAIAGRKDIFDLMFGGGVVYGGTFNGNPISLAGAKTALSVLSNDDGLPLKRANALGNQLRHGVMQIAQERGIPLQVTGFGTAFSLHFSQREELKNYRDTFADDSQLLNRFLFAALDKGLYLLPDGRIYVSTAHTEADIQQTLGMMAAAFDSL
jgi:glutamate-1-semialdehyde 2,1-aminomutase